MRPWFAAIYISVVELTQVKGPGNRNGCAMIDVPLRHSETFVRHCRAPGVFSLLIACTCASYRADSGYWSTEVGPKMPVSFLNAS